MAPKKEASNVQQVFDSYLNEAERGFLTILKDHLSMVAAEDEAHIQDTLLNLHSANTSELINHQRY